MVAMGFNPANKKNPGPGLDRRDGRLPELAVGVTDHVVRQEALGLGFMVPQTNMQPYKVLCRDYWKVQGTQ